MISRTLVILLAFGAALRRASQGAVVETIGLTALGSGLVLLRVSEKRPSFRIYAWTCFATTAISVAVVFSRRYL
jgi:hypothetical protein